VQCRQCSYTRANDKADDSTVTEVGRLTVTEQRVLVILVLFTHEDMIIIMDFVSHMKYGVYSS
jgi:hypothetical protein